MCLCEKKIFLKRQFLFFSVQIHRFYCAEVIQSSKFLAATKYWAIAPAQITLYFNLLPRVDSAPVAARESRFLKRDNRSCELAKRGRTTILKQAPFWGVNISLMRNVRGVNFYDTATAVY